MAREPITFGYPEVYVTIERGTLKNRRLRVQFTFGKQTVATEMGSVFRRSLDTKSQRDLLCAEHGVTWEWLRETMTVAEADAWLGRN